MDNFGRNVFKDIKYQPPNIIYGHLSSRNIGIGLRKRNETKLNLNAEAKEIRETEETQRERKQQKKRQWAPAMV